MIKEWSIKNYKDEITSKVMLGDDNILFIEDDLENVLVFTQSDIDQMIKILKEVKEIVEEEQHIK